jgi:tRNA pseudouridine55 synthase
MADGFAVVEKQAGWTSHDVVGRARKVLSERRVGHAGTLDPDATGVLLLGVGRATRLLRFLTALPKTYVGEVVFGRETSTLDSSGATTAVHEMSVDRAAVTAAAEALTGPIMQVPPMVSALKVDGRRLHEDRGGVVHRSRGASRRLAGAAAGGGRAPRLLLRGRRR